MTRADYTLSVAPITQFPEYLRTYLIFPSFPLKFIQTIWEDPLLTQCSGEPVCIVITQTYLTCFMYSGFHVVVKPAQNPYLGT